MALNTNLTSTSGFPNAIQIYWDRNLLERLELDLFMNQFGDKRTLPKNSGNEIKFTRYDNFAADTTALTEGTVPDGQTLQSTQVTAIPVQYGNYVALSDQLITEAVDPVIKSAVEVLSYQAALSLDTVIHTTLNNNMTSQFAGGAVSEITTSAVVDASEIRKAVKTLRTPAVRMFPGGYAGVIHPATSFDLQSDSAVGGWLDINKYTVTGPLYNGEIGKMYGVRFVESPNVQTGVGASSAVTYHNWIIGRQAYGVVDLQGHNMRMIAKQLGSSGVSDPLDQLSTVGYKFSHITKELDTQRAIEVIGTSNS